MDDDVSARRAILVALFEDKLQRDLTPDEYKAVDRALEQVDEVAARTAQHPGDVIEAVAVALDCVV